MDSVNWRLVVQRLIKSEMSLKGIRYQELSDKLLEIGVSQTADNLRNKVNKGILGADLLLQIMLVMDIKKIERERLKEIAKSLQKEG
ncbi:DUF6471 domain-containing protein [Planctobacterium marinum]|uniref:DUF6471 domain-containing protein n=1 Tax=Planctobacterium marinum TaxID=1631968 RepID=A0AA48HTU1_9ALTE|nr:hypothetical protein MACH26_33800 [Planctobacterium marinum]